MDLSEFARQLGRRGGLARAKALTPARRRQIARSAALSRHLSRHADRRIADNFAYLDAVRELKDAYRHAR